MIRGTTISMCSGIPRGLSMLHRLLCLLAGLQQCHLWMVICVFDCFRSLQQKFGTIPSVHAIGGAVASAIQGFSWRWPAHEVMTGRTCGRGGHAEAAEGGSGWTGPPLAPGRAVYIISYYTVLYYIIVYYTITYCNIKMYY